MITIPFPPVDACPSCPPGDHDACLPVGVPEEVNGGTLADYEHEVCGTAWTTLFDEHGWPAERLIAPVTAGQAAENRRRLERALDENARERRAA
jgi:hypothetical protein